MKKGLILIPFLTGFGGTETVIQNLLWKYNRTKEHRNIRLKLYSLGGFIRGNWLKFPNVHIIQYPKKRYLREFLYIITLPILILYIIYKEKPNFIIFTNPIMWTIAKIESVIIRKKVKIVAWYHYSYKLKPVKKFCLHRPDDFLTISKSGKNELLKLGISCSKIFVVYNPIMPTTHIIKHSKQHNCLVYVGRLEYKGQKNISELFTALSYLDDKKWHLYIYGTGSGKNHLVELSYQLSINNNINWMGFINNPFNVIEHADALILTSTYEGFPMVLAEAISHGLYVISSNCPSGPSEIINSNNGSLYAVGDTKELSHLINNVFNKSNKLTYKEIRDSINKFYIDNYFTHFIHVILSICK